MNKYDYRLPSRTAKATCTVCGQKIYKKFEDSTIELCREQATEWEDREHVCSECMKKQVCQITEDLTSFAKPELDAALEIGKYLTRLYKEAYKMLRSTTLEGRIVLYREQEWVIDRISPPSTDYSYVIIYLWRINKKAPWRTTGEKDSYIYRTTGRLNTVPSQNLIITNDTLDARKARYRAWQKAEGIVE